VRVLCRELRLLLELAPVSFAEARTSEYLRHNQTGKVPTFVDDDGLVIWESSAILIHLAEKRPEAGLLPLEPRLRSEVFKWLFFAANHVQPWVSLLGQERLVKPRRGEATEPARVELAERELSRFLPVIEQALGAREYLAERYTIADIALGCGFEGAEQRGIALGRYAAIVAWRERLRARPAWAEH
jgi:glutathione S-transferase